MSFFDSKLMRSKVKSSNVKFFPEAVLGYLGGPFFALVPNGIINTFLAQYWTNVLGMTEWASVFVWLMPLLSSILIIAGNLVVGKLMERKPKKAGKARPILFLSIPLVALALVALFISPVDWVESEYAFWILILTAVGYNLFYAIGWPLYYTAHSSLVNLSTRSSSQRGLLGTMAMAAQVGSAGVAGMAGGYICSWLKLLPSASNSDYWTNKVLITKEAYDALPKDALKYMDGDSYFTYSIDTGALNADRAAANGRWMIALIILVALLVVGCIIEYFFTRERVTEEQFNKLETSENVAEDQSSPKKVSMSDQIKICMKDKYWWMIMIFFLVYQLGGMLKNSGQPFYSQAWTGDTSLSSTIGIVGAIPTALGMVVIWPIANKFTKGKSIMVGGFLAALLGLVGFIPLFIPSLLNGEPTAIAGAINGFAIAGFVLKSIGTVPAMYISMALLSDVLDHQEAIYGKRTDGFSMAIYGSIMIAMTGISNAILLAVETACGNDLTAKRIWMTSLFFGGEVVAYLAIGLMFMFMNVEKYTDLDHKAIVEDQKAKCAALGIEYIDPAERMALEEKQAEEDAEKAYVEELRLNCEKKGLNFDEELAKHNGEKAAKAAEAEAKKAAADAKKAEKSAAKAAAAQAKYDALSDEQKAALEEKKAAKAEKAKAKQEAIEAEYALIREAHAADRAAA